MNVDRTRDVVHVVRRGVALALVLHVEVVNLVDGVVSGLTWRFYVRNDVHFLSKL